MCVCFAVQAESPVVSGGDAGWSERRDSGEHALGNSDVPVWEKGSPPVSGKNAAVRLTKKGEP